MYLRLTHLKSFSHRVVCSAAKSFGFSTWSKSNLTEENRSEVHKMVDKCDVHRNAYRLASAKNTVTNAFTKKSPCLSTI